MYCSVAVPRFPFVIVAEHSTKMEKVEEQFAKAVAGHDEGLLQSPGIEGMVIFFSGIGFDLSVEDVQVVFLEMVGLVIGICHWTMCDG